VSREGRPPPGGTPEGSPQGPRASDADRERFADELHENFAEGRLSLEELQRRLDLVFKAETLVDLYALTSDLPHPGPLLSRRLEPERRRHRWRWWPFR
jgi:Domain of unknown function (DUF1707)